MERTMITLIIHIVAVGTWLGCVLTEALFERALLGTGRENESILARLHRRVDLFVEIPAFLIASVTGLILIEGRSIDTLLMLKLGFAALAVLANIYCIYLVFRRVRFSNDGDWNAFERADHLQHKIGALVLVGILGAILTGLIGGA